MLLAAYYQIFYDNIIRARTLTMFSDITYTWVDSTHKRSLAAHGLVDSQQVKILNNNNNNNNYFI